MEIVHRISLVIEPKTREEFFEAGFDLPVGLATFEVRESDRRWPAVQGLIAKLGSLNLVRTEFTARELKSASYLGLEPSWHHGYPEPSDNNEYKEATFDLSDYCEECGIGLRQIEPFRLIKAPKWGNKSIFQLNWIFDEFFAKPDVWEAVFKPLGVNSRPVVLNRTGEQLQTVVQLDIPCVTNVDFGDHPYETCRICKRRRYKYVTAGFSPRPLSFVGAICKSSQYVGTGALAYRLVMISSELYSKMRDAGIKGVNYTACAPS